jgi:hypothetical protein
MDTQEMRRSEADRLELLSAVILRDAWAWRELSAEICERFAHADGHGHEACERLLGRLRLDGFHRLELFLRAKDDLPSLSFAAWLEVVYARAAHPDDPPEYPLWCGRFEMLLAASRRGRIREADREALAKHLRICLGCEAVGRLAWDDREGASADGSAAEVREGALAVKRSRSRGGGLPLALTIALALLVVLFASAYTALHEARSEEEGWVYE